MIDIQAAESSMRRTLTLAAEALEIGELPIAALVVLDDRVIASGTTFEHREKRYLGHAELLALDAADRLGLSLRERRAAKLFTNLEPCLMCLGAAMSFFLVEIIYGLESPGDGAVALVQGWNRKTDDFPGYRLPAITGGVMRTASIELFEAYVSRRRDGALRRWAQTLADLPKG